MKRIGLKLITLALLCAVALCAAPVRVQAEEFTITYVVRGWNNSTGKVVEETRTTREYPTGWGKIFPDPESGDLSLEAGMTYYVDRDITVNGRLTFWGSRSITSIVLGDGCTLDVKGVYVREGNQLQIFGQSGDTGRLISHPSTGAGIGGISGQPCGKIVINGGVIEATGADHCAGIGSNDGQSHGDITMYGGTIRAKGGSDGAAIGGGRNCSGGNITIYGGNITTSDSPNENGAGIGGGNCGAGGNITIYGGTIKTWSRDGAGIGGGDNGAGGTITIHGGNITSTKVNNGQGARIGGGSDAAPGTIVIDGGNITTVGGDGAGIGGGKGNKSGGSVTINGGVISASGSFGIGKGSGGSNVAITLNYTDATRDLIRITSPSYGGAVTLSQAFQNENGVFQPGTVSDTASLVGTLSAYKKQLTGDVTYLDASGSEQTLSEYTQLMPGVTSLGSGWYVVDGIVSSASRVSVNTGCIANIVLLDGAELNVPAGIYVKSGTTLNVFAQSAGDSAGRITAGGSQGSGAAAIGSNGSESTGTITINGGVISAKGVGGGAGIGGGQSSYAGKITINGGNVTATGSEGAAAIGGGRNVSGGMTGGSRSIAIHGGKVIAYGGKNAAAIGNGEASQFSVTIDGGDVKAIANIFGGVGIGSTSSSLFESNIILTYSGDVKVDAGSYHGSVKLSKPFAGENVLLVAVNEVEDLSLLSGALTPWDGEITTWSDLQRAMNGSYQNSTITLQRDITGSAADSSLQVLPQKKLTLDLNGHTLSHGLTAGSSSGSVIVNEGDLTIRDSAGGGVITGGFSSGSGGGIYNSGTLTLQGGAITGNQASGWGGGVYLPDNTGAVMNLQGGVITGNTAAKNGCGIHVSGTAALNASGAPQVYGNHKAGDETALNNINFASGAVMNLTGKLTSGANLGVRLSGGQGTVTTGYGAQHGTAYPSAFFTADNADYLISLADGEVRVTAPYTVTVNADDAARISVDKTAVGQGDTVTVTVTVLDGTAMNMISVTYLDGGATKRVNFTAGANQTGSFVMPAADVTVRINPPVTYWQNGPKTYSGNYTVVTSDTTTWTSGWYVVNQNVEISQRIEVQGDVKLVLLGTSMDSRCVLDAFAGIHVGNPNKMTIYGETAEFGILRAGTTKANSVPTNCAGIGGNNNEGSGPITINSGGLGAASEDGAAIGGGRNGNGRYITINGGNVVAISINGAAIGGGMSQSYDGRGQGRDIVINGGKVLATSGQGAGIGGGENAQGYDITINGGDVGVMSIQGAGIGGGLNAIGFQLNINGGNVMARSTTGAGIGFGYSTTSRASKGITRYQDVPGIGGGHIEAYSQQGNALVSGAGHDLDVDVTVGFDEPIRFWAGSSKETVNPLKKGQNPTGYKYVIIDVCQHDDPTWEITPTTHKQQCDYCYTSFTEEAHTLDNHGVCTVCGFDSNSVYVFFDSDGGTSVEAQLVSLGQKAVQPDDPEKEGYTFHGWHKVTDGTMETNTFDFNTAITESVTLKASWTHEHDGLTFLPWDSANSLPSSAGNYYLTRDVTLTNVEGWAWQSGEVNLCLNGHTITGDGTYQGLINVNGGAVHVFDEAGGAIAQTGAQDATVSVWQGGAFTLHGGSIGIDSDSIFAVVDAGSFTMTGGEVTGSARGVDVRSGAAFTVSGGARVAGSTDTNVQLASGQKIAIGGALSGSARIGVTMNAGSGVFTTGLNGGSASAFFSDDSSRAVTVGTDGEACIDTLFTVTVNPVEGSGEAFTVSSDDENNWGEYMAYGKFIHGEGDTTFCAPAGSAFTAPEGKLFLGWKMDGDDTLYDEGYFLPAGTYTITAQWANAHSIAWADMPEGASWIGAEDHVQAPAGDVIPVVVLVDEAAYNAGLRITAFTVTGEGIEPITVDKDPTGESLEAMVMGSTILYTTNFPMPDADVTVTPVISRLPSAAAPTFTPEGGFYVMAPSVTLASETAGAVIHYTTDGTTPTTESPVYTGPIAITETTTVRAIAVKEDMIDSAVAEAEYRYQHREVTLLPGEIDGASVAGETIVISGDDPASWTDMDTMAHGKFFRGLEEDVLFLYPDCPYTAPEGYIFSGWKHAESGDVDGGGKLTGQTVFTLIAQWELRYTVTKAALPAYAEWGTFTTELMEGDSFRPVVKIDGDAWQIGIRLSAVAVTDSQGHEIAALTQDAYGRDLNTVTAAPGSDGMVEISLARCTIGAEDVTVSARFTAAFAPAEFNLPAAITQVEESAFEGAAMESVSIPATCTAIGANAFKDCANLTRIRIPAGCAVGANAFDGCAKVFIFGTAGSAAETYCSTHSNCMFVPME